MPSKAPPPLPCAPVWHEFGRPSSGEAQDWTTWEAPLGDGGNALYRSLVLADGAIAVTVDLHSPRRSGPRTIHRGRCGLSPDPEQTAERVLLLLAAADRAAAKEVEAERGSVGAAAVLRRPSPRRVTDAPRDGRREDGVSAAPREREGHSRGHARREVTTAA